MAIVSAGIAIDKDGFIYFADGANIRVIDPQRNIRVLVGSQTVPRPWRPLACGKSVRLDEVCDSTIVFPHVF